MSTDSFKRISTIAGLLFVAGVMMVLTAHGYGTMVADMVVRNFGTLNTEGYYIAIRTNAVSFQIIGAIVASLSGLGLMLSMYLYKKAPR